MAKATRWQVRHVVARVNGADLAVLWRGEDSWAWVVTLAGERLAEGMAATLATAQAAAEMAARDHGSGIDSDAQLALF